MDTYTINLTKQGMVLRLPIHPVPGTGISIAVFDVMGQVQAMHRLMRLLADRLENQDLISDDTILVAPEFKAVPLVHELASLIHLDYVALRKHRKLWAGEGFSEKVRSITTPEEQTLWLYDQDVRRIAGKRVILFDDVISTGATLSAMYRLVRSLAEVSAAACVLTEGPEKDHLWYIEQSLGAWPIVSLGHIPLFTTGG